MKKKDAVEESEEKVVRPEDLPACIPKAYRQMIADAKNELNKMDPLTRASIQLQGGGGYR